MIFYLVVVIISVFAGFLACALCSAARVGDLEAENAQLRAELDVLLEVDVA